MEEGGGWFGGREVEHAREWGIEDVGRRVENGIVPARTNSKMDLHSALTWGVEWGNPQEQKDCVAKRGMYVRIIPPIPSTSRAQI